MCVCVCVKCADIDTLTIARSTEYLHNNKQAKAGGYAPKFAHQRALMSAFTGVLCQPID